MSELTPDIIAPLRAALYDFCEADVQRALADVMRDDAVVHLCHPFGDVSGPTALYDKVFAPLYTAIPDLERRDMIVTTGCTPEGQDWIGTCGFYTGAFLAPFLDIPPTGHQIGMRYHEFFRVVGGRIVEMQAIWDLPSLMMQADAWPMAPSLGREWLVPGPASQDGLTAAASHANADESLALVLDMLTNLSNHPAKGGPEIMKAGQFWHPRMSWYGPAGIGTTRGINGFRNWHQIPFLRAMPDRRGAAAEVGQAHFFAQGNYVAVTGWPNMEMTITGDGWLGIAPSGQKITLRSLDFWRVENGLIRENWVLVDLLDAYHQIGVDVLGRVKEFNKSRVIGSVTYGDSLS